MADRLLEAAPRDEAQIIQAALRSGLFLRDAPSTRAALVRRMEQMEDNARLRAVQERRRGMEAWPKESSLSEKMRSTRRRWTARQAHLG